MEKHLHKPLNNRRFTMKKRNASLPSLIDLSDTSPRIADITDANPSVVNKDDLKMIPHRDRLHELALTQSVADMIYQQAFSKLTSSPICFIGNSGISKTESILAYNAIIQQALVTISCSESLSAFDLAGSLVPETHANLPVPQQTLLNNQHLLSDATNQILDSAQAERRDLSQLETEKICHMENYNRSNFRFKESLALKALRNNYSILLDEFNLCPPNVSERWNMFLDTGYMFVLENPTFHNHKELWVEKRENTQLFATANPSTSQYGGRSNLSAAALNRWKATYIRVAHSVNEIKEILAFLIWGKAPSNVVIGGIEYAATITGLPKQSNSRFGLLEKSELSIELIEDIAQFHVGAASIVEDHNSNIIFSLRDLKSFLLGTQQCLKLGWRLDDAIEFNLTSIYVNKHDDELIAQSITELLVACDLSKAQHSKLKEVGHGIG